MFPAQVPVEVPDAGILERLASFEAPTQLECVNYVARLPVLASVPMIILGIVFLLFGWKIHKPLVTANAIGVGILIGALLGDLSGSKNPNIIVFGAIAGGVLFGLLALLLEHGAVSLMGALAGGAIGYGAWIYVVNVAGNPGMVKSAWAGALIGLVALGLLAYANFRLAVKIFSAFQGAIMGVSGIIALLMFQEAAAGCIRESAENNMHFLAALIAVPTVLGFTVQHVTATKKIKKKLKASSSG